VTKTISRLLPLFSMLFALAACGGGGGGGVAPPPPPPPPPPTGWQQGVFLDASTFADMCNAPRAGNDPTNNNRPYPDIQGTILDENNFLRSFSDDTYLWYDEITDRDPAGFNDPLAYFAQLKTFATLPSGREKDPDSFHFAMDSLEWFNLFQGGVSAGYGVEWAIISATPPRQIVAAFTQPNSPATAANVERGATILEIDGFDINTTSTAGVDALNAALFPATLGEMHDFTIRDLDGTVRQIMLTSEQITEQSVQNTQIIDTPTGKVGYMVFNTFSAPSEQELIDAINQLITDAAPELVTDLIVDLRYNGGGFGFIASQLGYMIAGPVNTAGKTFDLLQFNDKHPITNPITNQPILPDPFRDQTSGFFDVPAGQALPTLNLSRVFVLTGPATASASELLMNGLRGADVQVIQVGSTTRGKPYGFFEQPNCGTSYFTVQFRSVNARNWGDYVEGFQPSPVDDGFANVLGCPVPDDFTKLLGDPAENRLEVAMAFRDGLGCITPTAIEPGILRKPGLAPLDAVDGFIYQSPFESNLIMRRP